MRTKLAQSLGITFLLASGVTRAVTLEECEESKKNVDEVCRSGNPGLCVAVTMMWKSLKERCDELKAEGEQAQFESRGTDPAECSRLRRSIEAQCATVYTSVMCNAAKHDYEREKCGSADAIGDNSLRERAKNSRLEPVKTCADARNMCAKGNYDACEGIKNVLRNEDVYCPQLGLMGSRGRDAPSVDGFVPDMLEDFEITAPGGVVEVCVWDHECADGDVLKVTINELPWQTELENPKSCRTFTLNRGRNFITAFAVNGTGYKGRCSFEDQNTGSISLRSARSGDQETQTYNVRGKQGTSAHIIVDW